MIKRIRNTVCLVLCTFLLFSCIKEEGNPSPTRLLLVYMGTDNNLVGYEQEKLEGLHQGWGGKETDRILAYVDSQKGGGTLFELSDQRGIRTLSIYGNENSASPEVLSRVVNDVLSTYVADSYHLLVFSHASGWLPEGTLYNPLVIQNEVKDLIQEPSTVSQQILRSALNDGDNDFETSTSRSLITDGTHEMELQDFARVLPDGVFETITFEACFMAGIEVAYELRNKAKYILASSAEIIHPGFAPVYAVSTQKLLSGNLQAFGQEVFNHTLTYAETDVQRSATYSVIRTEGLEALAGFVRNNCDLSILVNIADIQHFDRLNGYRLFFDFEDYYCRLLGNEEKEEKEKEFTRLINDCVIWKAATTEFMTQLEGYNGFRIDVHSGLTTYIRQPQFAGLNTAYDCLQWAKDSKR